MKGDSREDWRTDRQTVRIRSVPGNSTVPLITSPKIQPTDHMSTTAHKTRMQHTIRHTIYHVKPHMHSIFQYNNRIYNTT